MTAKNSHRGIKETLVHLKRTYYWNTMEQTVASIMNACGAILAKK